MSGWKHPRTGREGAGTGVWRLFCERLGCLCWSFCAAIEQQPRRRRVGSCAGFSEVRLERARLREEGQFLFSVIPRHRTGENQKPEFGDS